MSKRDIVADFTVLPTTARPLWCEPNPEAQPTNWTMVVVGGAGITACFALASFGILLAWNVAETLAPVFVSAVVRTCVVALAGS